MEHRHAAEQLREQPILRLAAQPANRAKPVATLTAACRLQPTEMHRVLQPETTVAEVMTSKEVFS